MSICLTGPSPRLEPKPTRQTAEETVRWKASIQVNCQAELRAQRAQEAVRLMDEQEARQKAEEQTRKQTTQQAVESAWGSQLDEGFSRDKLWEKPGLPFLKSFRGSSDGAEPNGAPAVPPHGGDLGELPMIVPASIKPSSIASAIELASSDFSFIDPVPKEVDIGELFADKPPCVVVDGLADVLNDCGLCMHLQQAAAWCEQQGADSVSDIELAHAHDGLIAALNLKPNHWRLSSLTKEVITCTDSNATPCVGGHSVGEDGDGYCVNGTTGPKCQVCVSSSEAFDDKRGWVRHPNAYGQQS